MSKRIWIFRCVTLICAVALGVMIFLFSADDAIASSKKSSEVAEALAPVMISEYKEMTPTQKRASVGSLSGMLRKCGHAFEYMAFGTAVTLFALSFARRENAGEKKKSRFPTREFLLLCALVFCFLFAMIDEWHQTFVDGRSGEMKDVLLDFMGACCCALIVWGGYRIVENSRVRNYVNLLNE